MSNNILGVETPYGFEWGAAKIERCFSDAKQGWVTVLLTTPKYPKGIQIYVTKTGKVRIFGAPGKDEPREWLPVETDAK